MAILVLRARRRTVSLPTLVATSLLASVVVTAPFTAWAVVKNTRTSRDLPAFAAGRFGPENEGVDTTVIDRAARLIPNRSTYAIVISPHANQAVAGVFDVWAGAELLPRVKVRDLREARWIISFGAPPRRLGVTVRSVRLIASHRSPRLDAWVAAVG